MKDKLKEESKMAKNNKSDMVWVRVIKAGYISQLGMQGPIPNPIKISRDVAYSMIVSGIDVFEVDPVTKEVTKLTIQNVFRKPEIVNEPKKEEFSHQEPEIDPAPAVNNNVPNNDVQQVVFNGVTNTGQTNQNNSNNKSDKQRKKDLKNQYKQQQSNQNNNQNKNK